MADVIELTHPQPKDGRQSALFKYLLDRRHHDDARADPTVLPMLAAAADLEAVPADERRTLLRARGPQALADAGFSWERLSGWLPGGLDAEAWEAVIPSMGVMALVRNLRNFDRAGISERAVEAVIAKLTDRAEVAKARLFPYQVWAGYAHAPSDDWKRALGRTLDLTVANIPPLDGTLVVIDTSGSMQSPVSNRSMLQRVEAAAVMAMATTRKAGPVDVVIYGQESARVRGVAGLSVLAGVQKVVGLVGAVGHATYGHTAIARHFDPKRHRRVALFTDATLRDSTHVATVRHSLESAGVEATLYDDVVVEPTTASFQAAARFAAEGRFDGYISVGGGSVMDTCKAANLYASHPADFMSYVNAPIGEGRRVPGPVKP